MTKLILISCVVLSLLAIAVYDLTTGAPKTTVAAAVLIAAANGLFFAS